MRPRHLHPDAIADRHPVPVARRSPPPLWRGSDRGVEVMLPRAGLKDPVSHLSPSTEAVRRLPSRDCPRGGILQKPRPETRRRRLRR